MPRGEDGMVRNNDSLCGRSPRRWPSRVGVALLGREEGAIQARQIQLCDRRHSRTKGKASPHMGLKRPTRPVRRHAELGHERRRSLALALGKRFVVRGTSIAQSCLRDPSGRVHTGCAKARPSTVRRRRSVGAPNAGQGAWHDRWARYARWFCLRAFCASVKVEDHCRRDRRARGYCPLEGSVRGPSRLARGGEL